MKNLLAALFLLLFSGAGCGLAQESHKDSVLRSNDLTPFGPPPPSNYKEVLEREIRGMLKDPDSAKIEFAGVFAKQVEPVTFEPKGKLGWVVPVMVNAKNSYGGYTGRTLWQAWWRNGEWDGIYSCSDANRNWRKCPPIAPYQLVKDSIATRVSQ